MLIEEFDGSGDCEIRRIGRRGLVAASAGALLLGVRGSAHHGRPIRDTRGSGGSRPGRGSGSGS